MTRGVGRRPEGAATRPVLPGGKIMVLGQERVAYAGLLGEPTERSLGSLTVYTSLANPLRVRAQGKIIETGASVVIPPYTTHRITSGDRMIGVLMIEPESVDLARLPPWLSGGSVRQVNCEVAGHLRDSFLRLARGDYGQALTAVDLDLLFFGRVFERRTLDPRIAAIVERINRCPHGQLSAREGAQLAGLSYSLLLHLFRAQMGATFRGFRAWKRARSFLHYANGAPSLTDVALEIGYPDSTHFSHSIRQVYGLRPKDIFAGSRDLSIVVPDARPGPVAHGAAMRAVLR